MRWHGGRGKAKPCAWLFKRPWRRSPSLTTDAHARTRPRLDRARPHRRRMDGIHLGAYEFLEMKKTLQQRSTRGFLGKTAYSFGRIKPKKKNKPRRPANGGAGKKGVVSRAAGSRRSTYFATGCVLLLAEVCRGTATYHDALVLLDAARAIDAKREKKI
jgi:hypothetical protein